MKFLLNMNVPRELGRRLAALGHVTRHIGDIGMARASDQEVIAEADKADEVIITHDLDYGALLAFSGQSHPSVVILRTRDTSVDYLINRLSNDFASVEVPLEEGAIVVVEDGLTRIRVLPVR